jgi:hypothetical protein
MKEEKKCENCKHFIKGEKSCKKGEHPDHEGKCEKFERGGRTIKR